MWFIRQPITRAHIIIKVNSSLCDIFLKYFQQIVFYIYFQPYFHNFIFFLVRPIITFTSYALIVRFDISVETITTPAIFPLSLENLINLEHRCAAFCDYQAILRECTVDSACDKPYILVRKLVVWLWNNVGLNTLKTQVNRLLEIIYGSAF
jgi:hypothetical protein